MRDLIVVGGGLGGLALAGLTQSEGARVALCEAHTKLGGCAGYFDRDPFTFDVGRTPNKHLAFGFGEHLFETGFDTGARGGDKRLGSS